MPLKESKSPALVLILIGFIFLCEAVKVLNSKALGPVLYLIFYVLSALEAHILHICGQWAMFNALRTPEK